MNKLQFLTLYMETFCFNTSFVWALYVFIPTKSKEFVNYSGLRIIFMQKKKKCNDLADCLYKYAYARQ